MSVWRDPYEEARKLDHWWIGDEHVLLAVLARPSLASETLEELGIDYAVVAGRLGGEANDERDRKEWTSPTTGAHGLMGRAEAFAAVDGAARPRPEHVLLALIWADHGIAVSTLHHMGASQAAVLDGLRRRGVRIPDIAPPLYRPWRGRRTIEIAPEALEPLLEVLRTEHPAGSEWRWGFNWTRGEPRRATVSGEEGIDLDAALRASRGDAG